MIIQEAIESQGQAVQYAAQKITMLLFAQALLKDVDLSDCASIDVYKYSESVEITLALKDDCKDSHLVHKITQALGVNFEKRKHWWNDGSLLAEAKTDTFTIKISNYVPATCKIEVIETPIDEVEYQKNVERAIARVERVKKETKVICT